MSIITLTNSQNAEKNKIIQKFKSGARVAVLQGIAGSGKSTILPYIVEGLGMMPEQVWYTAYTGTATLNMRQSNSSTLHSLLYKPIIRYGKVVGFRNKDSIELAEFLQGVRIIVADEFSMIPADIMDRLEAVCRNLGILLLLVGDYMQLPPISGGVNKHYHTFDGKLVEPMRQALENPILWAANEVRQNKFVPGGIHGETLFIGRRADLHSDWLKPDVQFLCGLNATRESINNQIMQRNTPAVGDRIIFLRNDFGNGVSNGTQATITGIQNTFGKMSLDIITEGVGEEFSLKALWRKEPSAADRRQGYRTFADFAACITTHKSQGLTISRSGVILDESRVFDRDGEKLSVRWQYTALTRFQNKLIWLR